MLLTDLLLHTLLCDIQHGNGDPGNSIWDSFSNQWRVSASTNTFCLIPTSQAWNGEEDLWWNRRENWDFESSEKLKPDVLPPGGLSESRLHYLYSHVRPFVILLSRRSLALLQSRNKLTELKLYFDTFSFFRRVWTYCLYKSIFLKSNKTLNMHMN